MIDFRPDTVAAQKGVDRECKVQCRTVLRHGLDFSFRSKYEYLGGKQVQFDCIQKIKGIGLRVIQNFFDGFQPFAKLSFVFASTAFLVFPVCRESLFGYVVHAFAAYLYFNPLPSVAHQCHVQCLVTVGFRVTHPVAQTVGVRFVYF